MVRAHQILHLIFNDVIFIGFCPHKPSLNSMTERNSQVCDTIQLLALLAHVVLENNFTSNTFLNQYLTHRCH